MQSDVSMGFQKIHFFVEGTVQGVGFRQATFRKATALKLSGWVRNASDGRVEVYAEGPAPAIEGLYHWCHEGPSSAAVDGVELVLREEVERAPISAFEIR